VHAVARDLITLAAQCCKVRLVLLPLPGKINEMCQTNSLDDKAIEIRNRGATRPRDPHRCAAGVRQWVRHVALNCVAEPNHYTSSLGQLHGTSPIICMVQLQETELRTLKATADDIATKFDQSVASLALKRLDVLEDVSGCL